MQLQEIIAEPTDSSLVLAAQEGDREAFGQLAERYERAVYATALRRLNNHAEAQEVCQEVLVRAMQKISQLREPAAFGSWLQAVTNRMAINRAVRKRARDCNRARHAGRDLRRKRDSALGRLGARTAVAGPGRTRPLGRAGSRDARGVLRPGPVAWSR